MSEVRPEVPCPFCSRAAPKALRARDTNQPGISSDEVFDYYRCGACGLWFLSPVPADLEDRYPQEYYALPARPQFETGMDAEVYKLNLLRPHQPTGSLLEIGPACGFFAGAAKRAGYDVSVIEMNAACCRYMREEVGIQVHESSDIVGTLRSLPKFDVIALWHVIEHLPDPWEVLRGAADRLNDGGVLVFATPSPDAIQFRLLRSLWTHLDAPRHVFLLPMQQMVSFVRGLGLQVQEATCLDEGSLYWNKFGWEQSVRHLSTQRQRTLSRVGRLAAAIAGPFDRIEGAGAAYTIFATKGRMPPVSTIEGGTD
jgi:protein-L-isoaspartate O-methyltransferase